MYTSNEQQEINALINAVDAELQAFKQKRLKEYPKEYYSKPANRKRRNNYNKKYHQMLKLKRLK